MSQPAFMGDVSVRIAEREFVKQVSATPFYSVNQGETYQDPRGTDVSMLWIFQEDIRKPSRQDRFIAYVMTSQKPVFTHTL